MKNEPEETYPEPEENTGYQLWLATNALVRAHRKALKPLRLTFVQFLVLSGVFRLTAMQETVCQSDVCTFCSTDPNMTSQVVRTLEEKALLKRSPNPSDKRAYSLTLTPAGETLVIAARERLKRPMDSFFGPVERRQAELTEMLRRLVAAADS